MKNDRAAEEANDAAAQDDRLRWTRVGILAAIAIILGYLETFVPIPIPGVKLGLANIAILIALAQDDAGGAFGIAVIKVLASGLLFGSPLMMAYSAVGTVLAFVSMVPLSRIPGMHLAMVSVVGAMAHEVGQLLVAMALLGTPLVWYGAPVLLLAGCITGAMCGAVASRTVALLQQGETQANAGSPTPQTVQDAHVDLSPRGSKGSGADARVVLVGFMVFSVLTLHATSPLALGIALACSIAACIAGRVQMRDVAIALRPMLFMLVVTFVAQVASMQTGTTVAMVGPVAITAEALAATGTMMCRLLALTSASLSTMYLTSIEQLVDAIDWMLGPLRHIGLRTDGFVLALKTALEFVPLFAAAIRQGSDELRGSMGTRSLINEVFPRIIAQLYQCQIADAD